MIRQLLALCAGTFVCASLVWCADISGIWSGTLPDRNGEAQDVSFRFLQNGEKLSGKIYGENESTPIGAAKITGDQIAFTVGNDSYTGTIKEGEIEMTRDRSGGKTPNPKQNFHLKRLT